MDAGPLSNEKFGCDRDGSRLAESHNGPRPLPHKGFGREGDRPLSLARVAGEGGTIGGADGGVRADPKRERGSDRGEASFCGIADRPSPLALTFMPSGYAGGRGGVIVALRATAVFDWSGGR